jgi:hypothetical protein
MSWFPQIENIVKSQIVFLTSTTNRRAAIKHPSYLEVTPQARWFAVSYDLGLFGRQRKSRLQWISLHKATI